MKKAFLVFAALIALCSCNAKEDNGGKDAFTRTVAVGSEAPDFLFNDIENKPFRLSENKGKVTLLFFWRMKCVDCTGSLKSLEELHRRYSDKGLVVVTVDEDSVNSASIYKIYDFIKENGYTFRVLRDEEVFVAEAYQIMLAPKAFIIDKNDVIAAIKDGKTGWMDEENIKMIEKLLNGTQRQK